MSKPAAIVQGSGLNALGVVRSLAAERIPVTLIDRRPGGPATHSRRATPKLYDCTDADADDALVRAILAAAESHAEPPILILTQEAAVAALSPRRAALAGKVRFEMPDAATVAELTDKVRFQQRAEALGFPVPRAAHVETADDLRKAASLIYPCILKPARKSEFWERSYKKAYRFESFADLETFWTKLPERPAFIIQEWIEGGDSDVYFTLVQRGTDGSHLAFTGRKIRQWPPLVGGTASCMPAPAFAAELDDLTQRFFDAVGLIGLASMEYKRDSRSGRFVMVEPTIARTDYQEEVATLNGVNLVRAAYRAMAGLPVLPNDTVPPAIWRDAVSDESAQQALNMPDPPEATGLRVVDAVFRADDPGPWLQNQYSRVMGRLRRLFRR